jgi:hypothetical protein
MRLYFFVLSHFLQTNRAAEMEEVAKALADLGLSNRMACGTVDWQRSIARLGLAVPEGGRNAGMRAFAERLLPKIQS